MREGMLVEDRSLEPLGSGSPWKPSTSGRDIKSQQSQQGWRSQQQASSQRTAYQGLEMKSELVWEDWEPEKEFTKTLVLKNIHSELQKLTVRPPISKVFKTLIRRTIIISPGTSFSMSITFRPPQRCEYEDSIEFQGKNGNFRVSLRATIPCYTVEVPDSILLPMCAVQNSTQTSFLLRNVSKLETYFHWECVAPFQLSPEQGLLQPNQECYITVVFQPQEALVYQGLASCRFGEESGNAQSCCTVLLQGVASYPYLQLRNLFSKDEKPQGDPVLDFGLIAVGQNSQKIFHIFNPSPVSASFSLLHQSELVPLLESEFSCDVTRGTLLPGESVPATVTYTPAMVDTVSVEYLSLKCSGGLSETRLKLTGQCEGPKVSLSSSVLDFGCAKDGEVVEQTVELVNSSFAEAFYQMDLDHSRHSVFSIHPASGTVRPHSKTTLRALYRPMHPIVHRRRVACLILHREPMFLDLIGTCHSKLQQPTILKPEHLFQYPLQCYHRQDSQHTLCATPQDQKVDCDRQSVICPSEERADSAGDLSRSPMQEYFRSSLGCIDSVSSTSSSSASHITVVPSELVFNHKASSSSSSSFVSSQPVSITNRTGEKLSLLWTAAPNSPFSVSPSSCDLAPLKSTSFRVNYDPKQPNTLHTAQLECFAFNKDQLEERLPCSPLCVTVRVIGHYFLPGKELPPPCCFLKPSGMVFPALGVLSYRTTLIQNRGDLPLTFCLDPSSDPALAKAVSIVPSCGLIAPGCHQILTVKTTPKEDSPKQGFSVYFRLNATKNTKELKVVSVVEKLCVTLEGDGSLFFPPTAVCSQTQRSHHIRNLSHLPLRFQWNIPEPDQGFISVEPEAGVLHPNESSAQIWSFSPCEEKTYTVRPTLTFWPVQTPGFNESQLRLKVVGIGFKGFIEAEKSFLDVGEILVGSCRPLEVLLVNKSPCSVDFSLSAQQKLEDEDSVCDTEPNDLQLDFERATMTSQSTLLLRLALRPQRQAQYLWTISYQTLNASGLVSSPLLVLCEVQANVVYPTLTVIDVCAGGSVGKLSKVHLWKLFSLDRLNMHLRSTPTPAELTYKGTVQSPFVFTDTKLEFDFGAAPLNSEPSIFVLIFHNPGSNPVEWAFLMDQLEDVEEKHLFSISPRSGTLLPCQQRAVHFSYSHHFVGTKQYPVMLKLTHGREILVNLRGLTVDKDRSYLHFPSKRHVFNPVSIADSASPRQVYELLNGGAIPVHYEVDAAVLSQLQVDNFNHPVLRCLNPKGMVLPGQTAVLEWIFSPLEAKMYQMDIPIHVQNGDTTVVRFQGCGLRATELISKNLFSSSESMVSEQGLLKRPVPEQLVFLSEDSISFGDIPVCSSSSRLLFMINLSHTDSLHFNWDKSHQQLVQIHPQEGTLCPGETLLCVVTFTSTEYPACHQFDVFCQILQESELSQYKNALQRWEEEKERQQNEFIITDKNLTGSQPILVEKESVAAPVKLGPPIRKYKTLPPISASDTSELVSTLFTKLTRAERRAQREAAKVWRRPEPPQPFLLQLWVTAHSHGLPEYLEYFPEQFQRLDRYLQSLDPKPKTSNLDLPAETSPSILCPEKHIVADILTSLLWCTIDDPAFIELLNATPAKPVVYWPRQPGPFRSSSTPSLHPPPSSAAPPQPEPQPQSLSSGTVAEQRKQHSPVDGEGTAETLAKRPQTQSGPQTVDVPGGTNEHFLFNILQSLMVEAVRGELVLTGHPHTNILPSSHRSTPKSMDKEKTESLEPGQEPAGIDLPLSSFQC